MGRKHEHEVIDLRDLDKAEVLVALHAAARRRSHWSGSSLFGRSWRPEPISLESAHHLLAEWTQFDCIAGREMHLELGGDELHTWAYDKANGSGSARRALEEAGLI